MIMMTDNTGAVSAFSSTNQPNRAAELFGGMMSTHTHNRWENSPKRKKDKIGLMALNNIYATRLVLIGQLCSCNVLIGELVTVALGE